MQRNMGWQKPFVLPTDPEAIISGIIAARACTPIDPTRIDRERATKFLKAKWLPPIQYPDQDDEDEKNGSGDGVEEDKSAGLAYSIARGRFPQQELAKAADAKVHLKNNLHSRFIVAYRDQADLAQQRIRAEEEILRRLALNPEIPLRQRKVRPLSRDPNFVAQLKALNIRTTSHSHASKPSAALLRTQTVVTMPQAERDEIDVNEHSVPGDDDDDDEKLAKEYTPQTGLLLPNKSVRCVSKLTLPVELTDARAWIEQCMMWKVGHTSPSVDNDDTEYVFGRPSRVDDDVFTKAFHEVTQVGRMVRDRSAAAGAETRLFELQPDAPQSTDDNEAVEDGDILTGSLSRLNQLDMGPAPLPEIPRVLQPPKNPLRKHTKAFGAASLASGKNMSALLHDRSDHRLLACQQLSTVRSVYKLVDMDRRKIEKTPGATVVWHGVVPYLWFPNALALVRQGAKARIRRSVNLGSATAASDTAGSAAGARRGVGGRSSLIAGAGGGGAGGGYPNQSLVGLPNAGASLNLPTLEKFWIVE
ncbi:hypothetical protein HDU86_005912 [Geranomyces michiganensis]|nr:hypothetical protein HDU86_005912 [Geranomyces michiganensis]